MNKLILIGLGGALGALLRFWLGGVMHRIFSVSNFPIGTMTVNIVGCFVIGFLASLAETHHMFSQNMRVFLLIGVLGAFTTFSTFSLESFQLLRDGEMIFASLNIIIQVVIGLAAVWLGWILSQWL